MHFFILGSLFRSLHILSVSLDLSCGHFVHHEDYLVFFSSDECILELFSRCLKAASSCTGGGVLNEPGCWFINVCSALC